MVNLHSPQRVFFLLFYWALVLATTCSAASLLSPYYPSSNTRLLVTFPPTPISASVPDTLTVPKYHADPWKLSQGVSWNGSLDLEPVKHLPPHPRALTSLGVGRGKGSCPVGLFPATSRATPTSHFPTKTLPLGPTLRLQPSSEAFPDLERSPLKTVK